MAAHDAVPAPAASVFVTVGTDHHPFQRLVDWADRLAVSQRQLTVTVQYGSATPPVTARGRPSLAHDELMGLMRGADVVVAQGGPGGIMDARACGRLPIVVPRDPDLGEHIDDHQQRFAEHMRDRGKIALALDEAEFRALVLRALTVPEEFAVPAESSPTAATAAAVAASLHDAVDRRRRPLFGRRRPSWTA